MGGRRIAWPRGVREAGLSAAIALVVMLGLTYGAPGALRDLETASLDLRFRIRGPLAPGPETVLVMVDQASIERLGRWPLSRRLYATAVEILKRADARIIAFDLLFAEPEQPVPKSLREAAAAAAGRLGGADDAALRAELARIAADEPDADFAASLRAGGNVLLPLAFSAFAGDVEEAPLLAEQVYLRLDPSANPPEFPLQPTKALLPVAVLAEAAA